MPGEVRADTIGKAQLVREAGKAVPPINRADCEALDRVDPLRRFRNRFHLPFGLIYLDGNSLGAMPKSVPARISRLLEREWGDDLIRGWTKDGWMDLPLAVGAKIGSLIGAGEDETVVADSTSVNLFKVLGAALRLRPDRHVILSERVNFPTDLYRAGSGEPDGRRLRVAPGGEERNRSGAGL
jgi:kynureninase